MSQIADEPLRELAELLRIESISAAPERAPDVLAASEWVADFVRSTGGTAEVLRERSNLVVGAYPASTAPAGAPVVMIYGHVDVQPPGPLEEWDSSPFEPEVRGDWLYARGAADDKGNLYVLLKAAALLAAERALPVNVRILVDTQEEICGRSACDLIAEDAQGADACVIFDTSMLEHDRPVLCIGSRGNVAFELSTRTGPTDLHSGMFGGVAANAVHVLTRVLFAVIDLPPALRAGTAEPAPEELRDWEALSRRVDLTGAGTSLLPGVDAGNALARTVASTSIDVTGIVGGEPSMLKTVIPADARAYVSVRLAPGQSAEAIERAFRQLVADVAPPGASVSVRTLLREEASTIPPNVPATLIARSALERSFGVAPSLVRTGGTLPVVNALLQRGICPIFSGLGLPESNIHGPNERLLVRYVEEGIGHARHLLAALAALPAHARDTEV